MASLVNTYAKLQSDEGEPSFNSASIYNPAQTTNDYDAGMANFFGLNSSTAMQAGPLNPAENANQKGTKDKNALVSSFEAVQELMKGGQAIPAARGSAMESAFRPEQYSSIERDIRGNIIGASGRMQFDPISGAPVGKIAPDFKADTGGLGRPYTPGLDALKQAQIDSAKASAEAASTPAALQAQANRQAYIQSKASNLPKGATATEVETPKGIQRTVSGPSGYAQAFIPKKKPQDATA